MDLVMTSTDTEPAGGPRAAAGDSSVADDATEVVYDPDDHGYQRMSLRTPALIVLGIAVFILVGGVLASIFATSGTTTLPVRTLSLPDGTSVTLTPATTALKPIISSEPPSDILAALAVPAGSVEHHFVNTDQNVTQYDRSVSFTTGLSSDQMIAFFQTLLPKLGWKITSTAAATQDATGTTEVLATKGSQDGFYWEVGGVVSPTTSAGVTPFTIELFEQPDQD